MSSKKEGVKNRTYTNVELDLRVSCLIGNACVLCILVNDQLVPTAFSGLLHKSPLIRGIKFGQKSYKVQFIYSNSQGVPLVSSGLPFERDYTLVVLLKQMLLNLRARQAQFTVINQKYSFRCECKIFSFYNIYTQQKILRLSFALHRRQSIVVAIWENLILEFCEEYNYHSW